MFAQKILWYSIVNSKPSQKIIFTTSYYFDAWFFESTKQQGERAIGFTRTLKTRKNI